MRLWIRGVSEQVKTNAGVALKDVRSHLSFALAECGRHMIAFPAAIRFSIDGVTGG